MLSQSGARSRFVNPTSPTGGVGSDEGFEVAGQRVERAALQEMSDQAAWRGIGAVIFGGGLEGRWFGTMCLSEPQAGSSLSDIVTRAEPLPDATYRLKGSKMWISGGDHELSENIVHMVLAKLPAAPPGVKGISLFLAPRIRVNGDGSLGETNAIGLGGLNHKMGQRGTVNCLLNFSDGSDTIASIVGERGQGLACMFHMMNEARLGVGHAAAMCGLGGYLCSLDYARQRLQGSHPKHKDPTSAQLPIIEHADVKRMLLAQKAAVEGAMALTGYCATLVDRQTIAADAAERKRLDLLLGLLTPRTPNSIRRSSPRAARRSFCKFAFTCMSSLNAIVAIQPP